MVHLVETHEISQTYFTIAVLYTNSCTAAIGAQVKGSTGYQAINDCIPKQLVETGSR